MGLATDQPLTGSFMFHLSLGGVENAGYFKEFDGFGSEQEVIEHRSTSADGKTIVQKLPGQVRWNNLTLKRGVDSNKALWEWRDMVINGLIDTARKDGIITVVDSMMKPIATYKFVRGWPCRYTSPGISAEANEVLVEEVEIAHEGIERVE